MLHEQIQKMCCEFSSGFRRGGVTRIHAKTHVAFTQICKLILITTTCLLTTKVHAGHSCDSQKKVLSNLRCDSDEFSSVYTNSGCGAWWSKTCYECCKYHSPPPPAQCSPGCPSSYPGDGYCDSACNNYACNFDNGDCTSPPPPPTAPSPPPAPCSSWKPSNSEYTTGAGSSCQWQCRAGYYKSGDSCNQCETSSCSAAGYRRETCSNAGRTSPAQCILCDNYMPSNGEYSGGAEPQGSCPWQCKAGYYKSGNSCVACKTETSCSQGQFLGGQSCPAGSTYDTRTCSSCSSSCSTGEYLTGCGGSNAGSCTACPTTCGSGAYRQGCTGTNSGSCASCPSDSCGTGQYLDGCGGVSSGTCKSCPSCGANQFRSNCGGTSQGVCQLCNPSLCAPGQYLSGCEGTSQGSCQECTNLPSNARFTSIGSSMNDPGSCQWECVNGAERVGDTCAMGCTLDSGATFKNDETDSRVSFEAEVVESDAECKNETQTRTCQAGIFTAFDGTFSYDTCARMCKTESGEDVMPGDSASRNMYSQQSVPSGTACSTVLQVQTKKCNDGKLDADWSGDDKIFEYNQCEGECAPGCAHEMRGNGQSDGVCNVASCCYDDGDVLAGMMDHMLEARYYAFVGNETAAMKALKEISGDITGRRLRHLSYYEIDDSLEPIRRGNADEQMKVKEAARKQLESFQNGLDVLGMRTNEVDLAAWTAYEKVVKTAIEAIKAKQTEIDKAEGYLRDLMNDQKSKDELLSALKTVRDEIENSIETSFSASAESMRTIKRLVEKNGQQLELSIERTDALADAVRLNSRMLVKQEGLVMQNAQIMMETSSSLHDALGTISMDLKQEIMEGNVKVVGYVKDEFGKITNTLGDITQDLGEIKDITADGVNLIVTTVKNEATETRTVVRAEVNRAIDEISDVVETVGDEIINKTLVAIEASESRITARIGELENVMLEQFLSISSQLTALESHLVMMEKRLAQGGGYDLNGDGNVDDAEFAKLLEESGRLSPAALKVLKEFNGAATTDAQGRKLLFIGAVGKFLSNGFDAVKKFASKAFNAVGRTIGHPNAGKLIGTAVESVTGWDVDGDGNVGFADVLDTLKKTGQLVYDGDSLWDGYKDLKSQLNNRVPWSRLMDMMKTIDDETFTGGSTAHGHLRTAVALAHSAYNKGAMSLLTQCDNDAGWSFVSEVKGSSGDGRVVLHKNTKLKTVSVSFRGTINTKDWWVNAQYQLTSCTISTSGCGRVHSGFQTRYNDLKSNGLMQKLQDLLSGGSFDTLLVVGHSLGAALATLAAFDLATTNKGITAGKQIKVALFGSPQVGDSDFKAAYLRSVEDTKSVKAKCFVIPDVVTLVPNLAKEASGVIPSSLMPDFLDGAADYVHVVEPIVVKPGKFNFVCHQTLDHYADALESMGEVFDRFKGGACSKGAVPAEFAGGGGGEVARVASKLFGPNRAKLIKNAMDAVKKMRSMKSSAVTLGKTAAQCGNALSTLLAGNIAGVFSIPGCVRGIPNAARAVVSIGKTMWNGVKSAGKSIVNVAKRVGRFFGFGRRRHLLALPVPPPSSADDENVDDILGLKDLEQTLDEYDDNIKAGAILAMKKDPSLQSSNGVSDDMLDSAMANLTNSRLSSDAAAEYDDLAQQELRSLSPKTLGTATDAVVQTSDTYALSVRAWSSKSVQSKALEADSQLEVTTAEYAKSPPSCDSSMPWYKLQKDTDLKPADALEHIQSYYIPYLKQAQSEDIRELLGNVEMYRKQYHYDTLRTSDIDVSKVVSNPPTVAELEALKAKFEKEVQNDISRQGQKGSTMTVAYTIMRQQQPSVFEELITSPRKETSFTIPAPELSRYYNVRMRTVRAYVYPLLTTSSSSSFTVSVDLVKGGASSFFNDDRVLMQFVHQSPKPYLFKYKADTCETLSVPQIDEDKTYIKFSPYGSWTLSVNGVRNEELSRIENIRVEFEISYDQHRDFPEVSPMFANDRVNPSDVDSVPEGADRTKYCERSETKTTSSDSGGVSTTTTAASSASLTTTTQASSPAPSGSPGLPDSSITTSTTTTTSSAVSVTTTTSSTSSAEKRSVETSVQLVGLNKASFDAAAQQKFQRGVADTLGDSVSATDVEILAVNEVPTAGGRRLLQQTSPTGSSSALDINFRVNGFDSQQEANAAAESFESKVKDGSFVGNLKSLGIPVISVNLITQVNVYIINPGGNPSTDASSPTPSAPAGGDGGGRSDMMSVVGGAVGASLAILLSVVAYKICRRDFRKLSEEREKRASWTKVTPGSSSNQVDIVEDGDDVEGAAAHFSSSTKPTTGVVMGVPAADAPPAANSSDIMGAQNADSKLLRRKSFRTDIPLAKWNNDNVAHFIASLDMDPTTFEQNSVQGSDLIELDEATLVGDLGLKPFQAKKLVKEIAKMGDRFAPPSNDQTHGTAAPSTLESHALASPVQSPYLEPAVVVESPPPPPALLAPADEDVVQQQQEPASLPPALSQEENLAPPMDEEKAAVWPPPPPPENFFSEQPPAPAPPTTTQEGVAAQDEHDQAATQQEEEEEAVLREVEEGVVSSPASDAVTAILEASRLDDKYRQPLLDLGIAAASDLKDVVEEDLDSMGMTKLEKRRFLAAVAEL